MPNFLALDLETTGLSPRSDRILEVAWLPLNDKLEDTGTLESRVLGNDYTRHTLEYADAFVKDMHKGNGLWDEVVDGTEDTLHSIEDEILYTLDKQEGPWHLLGASVHFDKAFIENWMPRLGRKLSHRILDTSSLKLLASTRPGIEIVVPVNEMPHRAAYDVLETLTYARAFADFVAPVEQGVFARAHDPKRMRGII